MSEVNEEEKQMVLKGEPGDGNLMTSLIRASIGTRDTSDSSQIGDEDRLTESEFYGNIFVFNFAGHDTTAHLLVFAIVILAAYPDVQEWLSEEIRHVLGTKVAEESDHQSVFPRLKRCQAVLVSSVHGHQEGSV